MSSPGRISLSTPSQRMMFFSSNVILAVLIVPLPAKGAPGNCCPVLPSRAGLGISRTGLLQADTAKAPTSVIGIAHSRTAFTATPKPFVNLPQIFTVSISLRPPHLRYSVARYTRNMKKINKNVIMKSISITHRTTPTPSKSTLSYAIIH